MCLRRSGRSGIGSRTGSYGTSRCPQWWCESRRGRERSSVPSGGQSEKCGMSTCWRDERRSTLHAPHSANGSVCDAAIDGGLPRSANELESVRAEMFRSGVGALSSGSVLVLRRLVWCAKCEAEKKLDAQFETSDGWSGSLVHTTKGTRKIASKNPQEVGERENPSLLNPP